jgi:hypothetical protein
MPWGQRGNRRYYYRSVRRNGRVHKDYIGIGLVAEYAAEMDALQRAERNKAAQAWRQQRERMDAIEVQLQTWWNAGNVLLKAHLYEKGYHRHDRGQWRKWRENLR